MTNYEKLVETLRWTANEYKGSIMDEYDKDTMNAAADAIEALQATIELMKPYIPDFFPDANKVMLPKMEVQE